MTRDGVQIQRAIFSLPDGDYEKSEGGWITKWRNIIGKNLIAKCEHVEKTQSGRLFASRGWSWRCCHTWLGFDRQSQSHGSWPRAALVSSINLVKSTVSSWMFELKKGWWRSNCRRRRPAVGTSWKAVPSHMSSREDTNQLAEVKPETLSQTTKALQWVKYKNCTGFSNTVEIEWCRPGAIAAPS